MKILVHIKFFPLQDIMLKFEFNQDEREKHIEIKNKIKETFEQP